MELMVVPIITIVDNRKIQTVLTAIVFVIFYYVSYKEIQYVQQVLAASVFCLFGYITRPWLDKFATGNHRFKGFGWIALIIVAILSTMNETVGMYINQYGNKVMFLLTGIIGIYAIYDFSISLKNTSFIQWCGRQSIIIYILQFALIRFVIALQGMLSSNFCFDVYPSYMVTFIIVLTLLVPITKFCDKYLKFAFGK